MLNDSEKVAMLTALRTPFLLVAASLFSSTGILAQTTSDLQHGPREVLEEFVKSDLNGNRFREKKADDLSRFFTQPSQAAQTPNKVIIVSPTYDLRETSLVANRAEFLLQFHRFYGKLDSDLNFETAADKASNGVPIKQGILSSFTLIRVPATDSVSNASRSTEAWKIEGGQSPICISLATAIQYLTEISRTDADATKRENAARSLHKLRKLS
jgi:hypothetical protein